MHMMKTRKNPCYTKTTLTQILMEDYRLAQCYYLLREFFLSLKKTMFSDTVCNCAVLA